MVVRAGQGGADGSAGRGRLAGDAETEGAARTPVLSMVLMAVFVLGGSVGLVADWPAGPGNLDWGVWVVLFGGYLYVIGAAILHACTGR